MIALGAPVLHPVQVSLVSATSAKVCYGNAFSKRIEIERTTLSKGKNDQTDIGQHSDRLIRLVVMGQSADLRRWMERFMEKDGLRAVTQTPIEDRFGNT